jgi:hypothetical protein
MKIPTAIAILALASGLAGCGVADVISYGPFYSRAAATDLEQMTGIKPEVEFEWHHGRFQSVTVTFPRILAGKPLGELADAVCEVVVKEFKQTPDTIVLAFSLDK